MKDIALHVNNLVWTGWQEATVTHSIESVYGAFDLRLTRGWPGVEPEAAPPIREGDDCRLAIAGETVVSGFINQISLRADGGGFDLRVSGRDRTALLFKGGVLKSPAEWKGLDAREIAADIADPFGVPVRASAPVGLPFAKFTHQPGATAARAIERLCRHRALYPHADRQGGLDLTNADAARPSGERLVFGPGGNVLSSWYETDLSARHSHYVVRNQKQGVSWGENPHTQVTATARDRGVRQYAPRVVIPDEPGDAAAMEALAASMAALAAGRSRMLTHTVAGWRKPTAGGLWRINETAPVRDAVAAIDQVMLIKRAVLSVSPTSAPTTALTLVDPRAFALTAEPEPDAGGGWG